MSQNPIITFKAGLCYVDDGATPYKISPQPTPGYIYIYVEDDLPHFCWRPRTVSSTRPTVDLIMLPGDGNFKPYEAKDSGSNPPTNGRICVLKFSSSSARHLFWLQSKSQHPSGNPSYFSPRDLKLVQIVDKLIQGEEVDVQQEIANIPEGEGDDGDDDATMEDADNAGFGNDLQHATSGGAGADATGGDFREEGEESREGGADGGRAAPPAPTDASAAVANFLRSLPGSQAVGATSQPAPAPTDTAATVANFLKSLQGNQALGGASQPAQTKPFTTLPDLLPPSTTVPLLASASTASIDSLLTHVPPVLLLLAQEADDISSVDPTSETTQAALEALSLDQKKDILRKVLRSPQFSQSLGSLTMALRDGGLPSVSDALGIKVENGGFMRRGGMPLGGGEAVDAFLKGIRRTVEEEGKGDEGRMETD